ncbi:hypothetical protein HMPREF9442_02213 [Paraprevotella xylaniphila YIT 11841]|uniref:Uncharacterized protein n=1 Tax=Paraprevotella xylaniphila YIT 11841 TaxID=762982 RepID=F3QVI7_9BACT|nr:hypothetical protein HMPREF9442_02213 [Paraprevotella xylaniphila YIT 11841]
MDTLNLLANAVAHVNIKHGVLVSQETRMSAILLTAVDIWGSLVGLNEVLQADFLM